MKVLPLVPVFAIVVLGSVVSTANPATPAPEVRPAMFDPQDWMELKNLLTPFFDALGTKSGAEALADIKEKFPVDASSGALLAVKIDDLLKTFGPYDSYELIGVRSLPRGRRLYQLGYATYNRVSPALWEATVYRRKEGWFILSLSFNTEGILDRAREYK